MPFLPPNIVARKAKFVRDYFKRKARKFVNELSLRTRNALNHTVRIVNQAGNTTATTYADFLTKWHRNGWRLLGNAPRSDVIVRPDTIRVNLPRTEREVDIEMQWGRSMIPEEVYARSRPEQYQRERERLRSSHRNVINPRWFLWAGRAARWAFIQRRVHDRGWGWGPREDPVNGLMNFDRAMRRRYGRFAEQEPPRVIREEQLGDDFSAHWTSTH